LSTILYNLPIVRFLANPLEQIFDLETERAIAF